MQHCNTYHKKFAGGIIQTEDKVSDSVYVYNYNTDLYDISILVCLLHDLDPRLVDVGESLRFLWQLFGDVATNKHSL